MEFTQNPIRNYYEILGCDKTSSPEQIICEYKQRALECHPDKHPETENVFKFQELQEAKNVLCDLQKRKSYDRWLNSGIQIPFDKWSSLQGQTSLHWMKSTATKPSLQFKNENESSSLYWESESPSETLRKFRNYQI